MFFSSNIQFLVPITKGFYILSQTPETIALNVYLQYTTTALYGIEWTQPQVVTYMDSIGIEDPNSHILQEYLYEGFSNGLSIHQIEENKLCVLFSLSKIKMTDVEITLPLIQSNLSHHIYDSLVFANTIKLPQPSSPQSSSPQSSSPPRKRIKNTQTQNKYIAGVNIFPKIKKIKPNPKSQTKSQHTHQIKTQHIKTPISVTELIKTFFAKEPDNIYRNAAALEGSKLHKDIEHYLSNNPTNNPINNPTIEFQYFKQFLRDHEEQMPYKTEWRINSNSLALTGCIDILTKDKNNNYYLYDWKRVSKINMTSSNKSINPPQLNVDDCNYIKYALQLNLYSVLLKREHNIEVHKMAIVQLHPTLPNYKKLDVPNMEKEINIILSSNRL